MKKIFFTGRECKMQILQCLTEKLFLARINKCPGDFSIILPTKKFIESLEASRGTATKLEILNVKIKQLGELQIIDSEMLLSNY